MLKHADPKILERRKRAQRIDSLSSKEVKEAIREQRRRTREHAGEQLGSKGRPHRGRHGGGPGSGMMPGEKARDFKGTMKKLVSYMARYKIHLLVIFIFAIGSTVFNIIGPKVLSEATTALFNGVVAKIAGEGGIDFNLIGTILLTTLALYVLSSICSFVQGWTMSYVSQKVCYSLRGAIAEKINHLPYSYFDKTSTGDVLSRITNDVDTLGQSLNQGITQMITSVVTVIGVIAIMFSINWIMTLIALCIVPISIILSAIVVKHSQKYYYMQQSTLGEINGCVEETFSGHAIVKAFGQEDRTVEDFKKTNDRLYEAGWRSQFLSGMIMPIMNFVGNLGYVAVAISGAAFAVIGAITVGDIQAFIQYVKNLSQPITQLAQVSNVLQQMAAAAERIFAFLAEDEISATEKVADIEDFDGSIEFEHVEFGYDKDKPVINDFSAKVEGGQTIAIVGPTGAGKTTVVKLLMRFYDVDGGEIVLAGRNINDYSRDDVRKLFGMVLQDTWLFSGSIRDNIRYGRLDATDEEVEEAAREASVHHFISTLPGGYDFVINEDATNISAGQRQLLTIARAILADRQMMILDEATSSVDTRTEQRIQDAMDVLMGNRTSFVIAHRLSTIKKADLILVMEHGDIIEVGNHEELLRLGGSYSKLYNSQFRNIDPI